MLKFTRTEHYPHISLQAATGFIPVFVDESDPRDAAVQFAENYIGGWSPFKGFEVNPETHSITYPGDPEYLPLAFAKLREETIWVYPYAWVLVERNGKCEISRMD